MDLHYKTLESFKDDYNIHIKFLNVRTIRVYLFEDRMRKNNLKNGEEKKKGYTCQIK